MRSHCSMIFQGDPVTGSRVCAVIFPDTHVRDRWGISYVQPIVLDGVLSFSVQ